MPDDVRIGVIGLGAIGPCHIFAIDRSRGCRLNAVCDVRADAAAEAEREYGVPSFTSVSDMVAAGGVDAVTICTPSGFHREAALTALDAGKHALIEKPMEITPARIDDLIRAARARNVVLAGVFQSRFRPLIRRLKAFVESGGLGDIYAGTCMVRRYRTQEYYDSGTWRGTWEIDGGGCLMNQGIHGVDLFLWFMGPADRVMAVTDRPGRRVDVETLACAMIAFRSGARGTLLGTTLAYPDFPDTLELIGSRGTLAFTGEEVLHMELAAPTEAEARERDSLLALSEANAAAAAAKRAATRPGTAVPDLDMGHKPVVQNFVDAIRGNDACCVAGEEARRAVSLISAIYESGRHDGAAVTMMDD